MLNMLWAGMMAAGIFWAAFHGNMGEVTNGLLDSAKEAVTLGVTMLGIMSFWCGILKIGERAGGDTGWVKGDGRAGKAGGRATGGKSAG